MMDACGCRGQMSDWEVLIDTESPARFSVNYKFILQQTDHQRMRKEQKSPNLFSGADGGIFHIACKLLGMVQDVSHGH